MPPKKMLKKAKTAPVAIEKAVGAESGLNPMDNHLIIEPFFDVMPFDFGEFKSLRMVSRIWWAESLPKWRQNTWLCVKDKPENASIQRTSFGHLVDWLSLRGDPYKLLKDKTHFSKYRLEGLQFNLNGTTRSWQRKTNLWVQLGPKMTNLELSKSAICKKDLRRLLFQITSNLKTISLQNILFKDGPALLEDGSLRLAPSTWDERYRPPPSQIQGNLVELEVNLESVPHGGTDFPLCWIELFVRYPNLKVITLKRRNGTAPLDLLGGRQAMFREVVGFRECFRVVKENCGENHLAQLSVFTLHGLPNTPESFRYMPTLEELELLANDYEVGHVGIRILRRYVEVHQQHQRELGERAGEVEQRVNEEFN